MLRLIRLFWQQVRTMIGYKKNTLKRESLRSKDRQRFSNLKKQTLEQFWNNVSQIKIVKTE